MSSLPQPKRSLLLLSSYPATSVELGFQECKVEGSCPCPHPKHREPVGGGWRGRDYQWGSTLGRLTGPQDHNYTFMI